MPTTVPQPKPVTTGLDLTHRLAEDYAALPLATVARCVESATGAVRLFGEDVSSATDTVEKLARADLDALAEQAGSVDDATPRAQAG